MLLLAPGGCEDLNPALALDTSQLPPVTQFSVADLDSTKFACTNLNTYANGKWLAATAIPADRSRWGAFEMLAERSLAVQRQVAEQTAARPKAAGVEKIIGDFWVTGMDTARINAQGILPLRSRLAAIDSLQDGPAIAAYLRRSAARGENALFGFGAAPDFKNSTLNIAYVVPGGLGLPERGYYFDPDKRAVLAAYGAHVARVLELSGVPADSAAARVQIW